MTQIAASGCCQCKTPTCWRLRCKHMRSPAIIAPLLDEEGMLGHAAQRGWLEVAREPGCNGFRPPGAATGSCLPLLVQGGERRGMRGSSENPLLGGVARSAGVGIVSLTSTHSSA